MVVLIGAPQTAPTWDQVSGKPDFTALGDLPEAAATVTAPIAANALIGLTTRFTLSAAGTQPLPSALPGRRLRIGSDGGAALSIAAASGDVIGAGSATTIAGPLLRGAYELRCTVTGRWRVTVGYLEPDILDARYMPKETGTAFRAYNADVQTIPNTTDTVVALPTVSRSSALVTPSAQGAGHKFTLNRAGLWVGNATARVAAASAGEVYVAAVQLGVGILAAFNASFGGPSATRHLSIADYFDAGAAVYIVVFQSAGSAKATEPNAGNWCQIKLNWVHD